MLNAIAASDSSPFGRLLEGRDGSRHSQRGGGLSVVVAPVSADAQRGLAGQNLATSSEVTHNKAPERTVNYRGPRLAAAWASWSAAHFTR